VLVQCPRVCSAYTSAGFGDSVSASASDSASESTSNIGIASSAAKAMANACANASDCLSTVHVQYVSASANVSTCSLINVAINQYCADATLSKSKFHALA
jgi:hypothetical protein